MEASENKTPDECSTYSLEFQPWILWWWRNERRKTKASSFFFLIFTQHHPTKVACVSFHCENFQSEIFFFGSASSSSFYGFFTNRRQNAWECRRVVGDSIRRRTTVRLDEKNITIVNVNCDDLATNWLTYIKFIWLVCLRREIPSEIFYELIYDSNWLRPIGIYPCFTHKKILEIYSAMKLSFKEKFSLDVGFFSDNVN